MTKTIATPHPDHEEAAKFWTLPRTLMGGTSAMRNAGQTYLPKEAAESQEAYTARLARTVLFNAFAKTVKDMKGRLFAKPVVLSDDVPPKIVEWCENCDLTGRHINVFLADVTDDAMQTGAAFILVDTPKQTEGTENRATQGRPYLVHLRQEDIIGWTVKQDQDGVKLETLRYYETVEESDGIHVSRVQQIKMLKPEGYDIYRKTSTDGEWKFHEGGTRATPEIPLAGVYFNRHCFMVGLPPLQDLADLNVTHWQSSSDQRNILHVARVPILFGAGFPDDSPLVIGSASLTRASDPAAKLSYVEHTGAAISSGRDDLKDLEFQMQAMGLQLLVSAPGQTATGEVRDDIKENSRLASWSDALQDGAENALVWMARLGGLGGDGGSIVVNDDFGISARSASDIASILAAYKAKLISRETSLKELQRRGLLGEDVLPEDEIDRVDQEALAAMENIDMSGLRDASVPPSGETPVI